MDLECVDVKFLGGVGFCEIGLNCIPDCPYSYGPGMEGEAETAFGIEYEIPDQVIIKPITLRCNFEINPVLADIIR